MIDKAIRETRDALRAVVATTREELDRLGAVLPSLTHFDHVLVDFFGQPTPVREAVTVKSFDNDRLLAEPLAPGMLDALKASIEAARLPSVANVGIDQDKVVVRFVVLSERRRASLIEQVEAVPAEAKSNVDRTHIEHCAAMEARLGEVSFEDFQAYMAATEEDRQAMHRAIDDAARSLVTRARAA